MIFLPLRRTVGLVSGMRNPLSASSDTGWKQPSNNHPHVEYRDPTYRPMTVGDFFPKGFELTKTRLRLVLEYLRSRPRFVKKWLPYHLVEISEHAETDKDRSTDFTLKFSSNDKVGLNCIEHVDATRDHFRQRQSKDGRKILKFVVNTSKKIEKLAMELLRQIAWHSKSIFGVTARKYNRHRQDGECHSSFRRMDRFQPNFGSA